MVLSVRFDPFLLVTGKDDLRDIHLLTLPLVHGVDDRVDSEVGADELEPAGHSARESSQRREIRRGSDAPADAFLRCRRTVHLLAALLDLTLEGSLPNLFREAEERVSGSFPEDIVDG